MGSSTVWHGLYPCYWVAAFHYMLADHVFKLGYKMYNNTFKDYQESKGFYILETFSL